MSLNIKGFFLPKNIVNDKIWFQKKYVMWISLRETRIYKLKPNFFIFFQAYQLLENILEISIESCKLQFKISKKIQQDPSPSSNRKGLVCSSSDWVLGVG